MAHKYNFELQPIGKTISVVAEDIDDAYGEVEVYLSFSDELSEEERAKISNILFLDDAI